MAAAPLTVAIVDPYSSGRFLVTEFAAEGCRVVCVQTSRDLAPFWLEQHVDAHFFAVVRHDTLKGTAEALAAHGVAVVVAGSEPRVLLAEAYKMS